MMPSKPSYDQLEKRLCDVKARLLAQEAAEAREKENPVFYRPIFEHTGVAMIRPLSFRGFLRFYQEQEKNSEWRAIVNMQRCIVHGLRS